MVKYLYGVLGIVVHVHNEIYCFARLMACFFGCAWSTRLWVIP